MDYEMKCLEKKTSNGHDGTCLSNEQVPAGNGETHSDPEELAEQHQLLSGQRPENNGERSVSVHIADTSSSSKMKGHLNEVVFWKIRLWMVLLFIFFLLLLVILVSMALCSVIHEDVDEKFDPSSFNIPRYFNGTLRLTNQIFTEELLTPSSNQSQDLSSQLQEKLAGCYRLSPALGRYFSNSEIYDFRNSSVVAPPPRNSSVVALYRLRFHLPEDHAQLQKFTLSREVVFTVLRQFLYDQETDPRGPLYVEPGSLEMF